MRPHRPERQGSIFPSQPASPDCGAGGGEQASGSVNYYRRIQREAQLPGLPAAKLQQTSFVKDNLPPPNKASIYVGTAQAVRRVHSRAANRRWREAQN